MKPQPPVTKMRIAAPSSSSAPSAPVVSPGANDWWAQWKTRAAQTDWTPWLIIALGAFLRVLLLGMKPAHFDEGINGWFVDQMTKTGFYRYDPTNYHGPLHFYVLFLSQTLFGRGVWALRMPVVIVSTLCLWLALRFESIVGRSVARLAALAMAVSPGFVFYGRYSIHEVWLLLFSMMFVLGLLGLWTKGSARSLWLTGMGITGMILTKETYIIHLVCAAIAIPVTAISCKLDEPPDWKPARQTWRTLDFAIMAGTAIALIVFFYSGTFFNWSGVAGLFETFSTWIKTGTNGNGHEKPWYYWLMLMGRYEWPISVGLLYCVFCQKIRSLGLRYLAIYGVGTLAAYSIVHYKTPWCIISIAWPFLFLFGAAVFAIPDKQKTLRHFAAAIFICASLGASIRLNYFRFTTDTEPYVYVQSYEDIYLLSRPLLKLAHQDPRNYQLVGHMIRTSAYPFPWILGDFPRIGYYENNNLPSQMDADFLLVQEDKIPEVEPQLHHNYFTMPLTIRPYQDTSKLYLSAKVFARFFPGKKANFHGAPR